MAQILEIRKQKEEREIYMERDAPVGNPHASTADLLSWSENPPPDHSSTTATRSHQPSDRIGKVLSGNQVTDAESEALNKTASYRKNCSGHKLREMTGSSIFSDRGNRTENITGLRHYQEALNGTSQISFRSDGAVSPKKPTTLTEVAKQRELSETTLSECDSKNKKQTSDAKMKEMSGHDIFEPPSEIQPRSMVGPGTQGHKESRDIVEPTLRNLQTSAKVSNSGGGKSGITLREEGVGETTKKMQKERFQELNKNDIYRGEGPHSTSEKMMSSAKKREMSGNNIFEDGKSEARDYFGGVRRPPGGESSIELL